MIFTVIASVIFTVIASVIFTVIADMTFPCHCERKRSNPKEERDCPKEIATATALPRNDNEIAAPSTTARNGGERQ